MVAANREFLARRITDSTRLPLASAVLDIQALARILLDFGTLLDHLEAGTLPHPSWQGRRIAVDARRTRGDVAALLPEAGAARVFGQVFAPAFLWGANVFARPASRSRNLFQTLEALLAEEDLGGLLRNPDGSRCISHEARNAFLDRHLDPTSRTGVLQLEDPTGSLDERIRQHVLRKKSAFRLLVNGPAKNRAVVTSPLADPSATARALVEAALAGSAQGRGRIQIADVHESVLPDLLPHLAAWAATVPVGDPYDPAIGVGPLPVEQARAVAAQIMEALSRGAELVFATERAGRLPLLARGEGRVELLLPSYASSGDFAYLPVMVLAGVPSDARLAAEPTPGPVLALRTFRTDQELVPGLLGSPYGLGAMLFGDEPETRHADLLQILAESHGTVDVNPPAFSEPDPLLAPSGGFRRSSFTLLPSTVEGHPALVEIQTGPTFTGLAFTRPEGEPS